MILIQNRAKTWTWVDGADQFKKSVKVSKQRMQNQEMYQQHKVVYAILQPDRHQLNSELGAHPTYKLHTSLNQQCIWPLEVLKEDRLTHQMAIEDDSAPMMQDWIKPSIIIKRITIKNSKILRIQRSRSSYPKSTRNCWSKPINTTAETRSGQ